MNRPKMQIPHSTKYESGAALIIALLVIAMVTGIATEMTSDYLITVKRASNQVVIEQSYSYLRAAEELAKKVLRDDILLSKMPPMPGMPPPSDPIDSCDDIWAAEVPPFILEDGAYGGRIHDLQGRFNLNSLMEDANRLNAGVPNSVHQHRFMRLLQSFEDLEVSFDEAQAVTQALLDYLDTDSDPEGFGGAEDSHYDSLENRKPHRPANRTLMDTSELLLVAHMRPKLYKALIPHITVWPQDFADIKINVNTATSNVLRSLHVPGGTVPRATPPPNPPPDGRLKVLASRYDQPLNIEQLKPLLDRQLMGGGFTDLDDFKTACNTAGGTGIQCNTYRLSTDSSYFKLNAEASIGDLTTRLYSVMKRSEDPNTNVVKVQVISRSISGSSVIESCMPLPTPTPTP